MGWLDSIGSGLSSLWGGAKNLASSGAGFLGQGLESGANYLGQGMQGLGNLGSKAISGIGSLFGGGGGGSPNPVGTQGSNFNLNQYLGASHTPGNLASQVTNLGSSFGQTSSNPTGGGIGVFSQLFKNPLTKGLLGVGASQLIQNPKVPSLPSGYSSLMSQIESGGNPLTQAAGNYYQNVLTGNDQAAYDQATRSIDLNYEEQLRQLNSMYKSLRPGTDPTSDSTYQRDLQNLNNNYQQQRAMALAGVQQGAAGAAMQGGQAQIANQMAMLQPQIDQANLQFQADYAKRNELRNLLMGLGGNYANYGALSRLFPNLGK